jgi:predicted NBD/HSP70 family sugar kinase
VTRIAANGQTQLPYVGGTPRLLRSLNARTVLEHIRTDGPISRAQIARGTGLSKPTVSLALSRLVDRGIVREVGRSSGSKGPTAVLYRVDPLAGHVVGIDVGRGWLRAAVADLEGEIVAQVTTRSTSRSSAALLDRVDSLVAELLKAAGLRRSSITRWVLGTPGITRPGDNKLVLVNNLPGWNRPGVLDALRKRFGNVVVENDVNLAAIGEQRFGRGRGVDNFVFISVGTGVGMGLILGGHLYRGSTGAAGEIGYLPVGGAANGRRALHGLLESSTGARAVVAEARAAGMPGRLTAESVFAAAREGHAVARKVVDNEAARIGLALAAVVPVVDPALVVLGGGIGKNVDLLLAGVRRQLHATSPFRPQIVVSALGDDAVIRGALATALDLARDEVFSAATDTRAQPAAAFA